MDESVALVKQGVDIVDVVGGYLRLDRAGAQYRGLCPFHEDHKPSLNVDPQYQSYRCWACGAHGDVIKFVMEMDRLSFREALERLAERAGIKLGKWAGLDDSKRKLFDALAWAQQEFEKCLKDERLGAAARQYLAERGLTGQTCLTHGVGFAPPDFQWLIERGKRAGFPQDVLLRAGLAKQGQRDTIYDLFRGRVLFPIRDERGRVRGFGGRILPSLATDQTPKYINNPATEVYNKSETLYGIQVAVEALARRDQGTKRPIVVMEGYTDCLMAYQHGIQTAVATCGTALTPKHVNVLRRLAPVAVLLFDGDQAGQKAARDATALALQAQLDVRLCLLPDNLDPCDYLAREGADALWKRIDEAPDALDHEIRAVKAKSMGGSIEQNRELVEGLLRMLAQVPLTADTSSKVKFDLGVNRVADAFKLSEQALRRRINEFRQAGRREVVSTQESIAAPAPMIRRDRELVQWMIHEPGKLGELEGLIEPERIQHNLLRRLAQVVVRAYAQWGADLNHQRLVELIDDPELLALHGELKGSIDRDLDFAQWRQNIKQCLEIDRRRQVVGVVSARAQSPDPNVHLETLRRLRDGNLS